MEDTNGYKVGVWHMDTVAILIDKSSRNSYIYIAITQTLRLRSTEHQKIVKSNCRHSFQQFIAEGGIDEINRFLLYPFFLSLTRKTAIFPECLNHVLVVEYLPLLFKLCPFQNSELISQFVCLQIWINQNNGNLVLQPKP